MSGPGNSVLEPIQEATVSKKRKATEPTPAPLAAHVTSAPGTPAPGTPSLTPVGFDYKKLALGSPLTEFEAHAKAKIKTAERLGQKDEVEALLQAFEMGKALLAEEAEPS